jgi:hypothetical protein
MFGKIHGVIAALIVGLVLGLIFDYAVDWGYKVHLVVGIAVYVIVSVQMAGLVLASGLRMYAIPIVIGEAVALGIMYSH